MSTAGEISGAKKKRLGDMFDGGESAYPKDPLGWFCEEPWTVEALWRHEYDWGSNNSFGIPTPAWDPACGAGNIPKTLAALGVQCLGTDIVDRGYPGTGVLDFLTAVPWKLEGSNAIVTNPPYDDLAERFVLRGLDLVPYVAVLVQTKFQHSQGRYERLFGPHPPSRILIFVDRPSMPPGHLVGKIKASGGKMDFLWMIWDKRTPGPTTTHWIRRPGR